jgi:hypothetical protein
MSSSIVVIDLTEEVIAPIVEEEYIVLLEVEDVKRKVEDDLPMEEGKKARSDKREEIDDEEEEEDDIYDSEYDHCFEILNVDAFDHAVTKIAARKGDTRIYNKHMNYIMERKREEETE